MSTPDLVLFAQFITRNPARIARVDHAENHIKVIVVAVMEVEESHKLIKFKRFAAQ